MKILVALLFLGLTSSAIANSNGEYVNRVSEEDRMQVEAELNEYRAWAYDANTSRLHLEFEYNGQVLKVIGGCGVSVVLTVVSFAADVAPFGTGAFSEMLANSLNSNYDTFDAESTQSDLESLGRSTMGAAGVTLVEILEAIVLHFAGEKDQDDYFKGTKKVMASSQAVLDAMFADKSMCLMSIAKTAIASKAIKSRR